VISKLCVTINKLVSILKYTYKLAPAISLRQIHCKHLKLVYMFTRRPLWRNHITLPDVPTGNL